VPFCMVGCVVNSYVWVGGFDDWALGRLIYVSCCEGMSIGPWLV